MENKDQKLWTIAKKRAAFKRQLFSYIVINIFVWAIWFFTSYRNHDMHHGIPWPAWVSIGWGIGIAFSYYDAYNTSGDSMADKEYEKLKNKQQ